MVFSALYHLFEEDNDNDNDNNSDNENEIDNEDYDFNRYEYKDYILFYYPKNMNNICLTMSHMYMIFCLSITFIYIYKFDQLQNLIYENCVNKYEYNLINFICDTHTCSPIELEKDIYYINTIDIQSCNINECSVMVI